MLTTLFSEPIYVLLFVYLYLSCWIESAYKLNPASKILFYISIVAFIALIGLRWETGTDWNSYYLFFDSLTLDWSIIFGVMHFDLGYVIINAIVKFFTKDYTLFLIFNSIIAIISLAVLIRKTSPFPNLSLFIFYTNYLFSQYMGSNRRMIAMSLVLWSVYYVAVHKQTKAIVTLIASFLFHRSSIFNACLFAINQRMYSAKRIVLLISVSVFIGILQIPMLIMNFIASHAGILGGPMMASIKEYSENGADHLVYGTGNAFLSISLALIKRLIFICIYLYVSKKIIIDKLTAFVFNVYIWSIVIYIAFIGSFFQMISTYWAFVEILLVARFYRYMKPQGKIAFLSFIGLFGLFQLNNALNVYPDLYIPYKTVFNK